MTVLLLLFALQLPNPVATPGAAWPLTTRQVCTRKWGLDVRHVTRSMRQRVFVAAGIPWATRARYVVDHLIPRQLGGVDAEPNLWVQPKGEARTKDVIETRLHKLVCTHALMLRVAQRAIAGDWVAAHETYRRRTP